jgi:hypothetical protein
MLLLSCCGFLMNTAFAWGQEDAWRPASPSKPGAGVRLGKPIAKTDVKPASASITETAVPSAPVIHTARFVQPPDPTAPPGAPPIGFAPGSPEEDFNCGVVTGPGAGTGILSHPGNLFSNPFSGGSFTFQSDHCFDRFISPVTNPFYFEDPRSLTELRPVAIYQHIPGRNSFYHGGDFEGFFLQGRLAFTEYFSIVVSKLGWVQVQPDHDLSAAAPPDASGFAELQFGPKFTFIRSRETNTIVAAGVNFALPTGTAKIFQNRGSGSVTPYISAAQQLGDNWHLMGTFGYSASVDSKRSDWLFTSLHLDYGIYNRIYPLVEVNWYHYTTSGKNLPANFEGEDLVNFGSTNVAGNDLVTAAIGVRVKIIPETLQFGLALEAPITHRHDIMDYRVTADLILRY